MKFEDYIKYAKDDEVAALLYSLEKEADEEVGSTEEFLDTIRNLLGTARTEYLLRDLHYTMFLPEDQWEEKFK